jgi:hypothetical protein
MCETSIEGHFSCDLKLEVKSGVISGGGLPNSVYVEVLVDDVLIGTTDSVASGRKWNAFFMKRLTDIDISTTVFISFVVHKKRWTSCGHKQVGTAEFPLGDILENLNQKSGPTQINVNLVANKHNLTLGGSLLISWELVNCEESATTEYDNASEMSENEPNIITDYYSSAMNNSPPLKIFQLCSSNQNPLFNFDIQSDPYTTN